AHRVALAVRAALHVVRDVVRHGEQQGLALELEQAALVDNLDRSVSFAAPDPAQLEESVREGGSESAGDVKLPFTPVEAAADDRTPLRLELREVDSERRAAPLRSGTECVVPIAANDDALPLQSRSKVDAEAAGEMVVAGACGADQLVLRRLA